MSRSHGTGQPIFARCAKCRGDHMAALRYGEGASKRGTLQRMELTGRHRYRPNNNGGRVDVFYQYEYKCLDCGHVGWSRHIDVAGKFVREHGETTRANT